MNNKEYTEREVEKTLEVLDQVQRVDGNPYLYTRLKARMAAENRSQAPVWQAVLTGFILVINGVFLFQYWQTSTASSTLPQALSQEWGLNKNDEAYYLTYTEKK